MNFYIRDISQNIGRDILTRTTLKLPQQISISLLISKKQTNSVALSPRANYTDWATATCRRNLVPTFVDRGVSRGQRGGYSTVVNLSFLDRIRYFFFSNSSSFTLTRAEWTPFQTHCYSENLVAQRIEPGPLCQKPGTLTTRPQRRSSSYHT
jgi:hypothetical protein